MALEIARPTARRLQSVIAFFAEFTVTWNACSNLVGWYPIIVAIVHRPSSLVHTFPLITVYSVTFVSLFWKKFESFVFWRIAAPPASNKKSFEPQKVCMRESLEIKRTYRRKRGQHFVVGAPWKDCFWRPSAVDSRLPFSVNFPQAEIDIFVNQLTLTETRQEAHCGHHTASAYDTRLYVRSLANTYAFSKRKNCWSLFEFFFFVLKELNT